MGAPCVVAHIGVSWVVRLTNGYSLTVNTRIASYVDASESGAR